MRLDPSEFMKNARFRLARVQRSRACHVTASLCFATVSATGAPGTAEPPPAPPEPAVAQSPPGAEPESLASISEPAWLDEPEPEAAIVRAGLVLLPYVGFALAGSGTLQAALDCDGNTCTSQSREREYGQNANFMLGFDTLYHVLPNLRLGLGLQWMPTSDVDVEDGDSSTEFGDELSPTAVVEGIFGGKSAGALRGFVGPNFLFAGSEMQELIDTMHAACHSISGAGGSCSVASGPYVGLTLGAAGAFLRQLTPQSALRVELALQYVRFSGPSLEVSDEAGGSYEDSLSWSGTRVSLRFGIEL